MASLGHVAIGVAAARLARTRLSRSSHPDEKLRLGPAMLVFAGLSLLPDADVIGFSLGVSYDAPLGHRGASHSLAFALLVGVVAAVVARAAKLRAWRTGLLVGLVVATHGPLDMLTDGGRGVAILWPYSDARFFFPWQPIPVAPIGLGFLSVDGLECARNELLGFLPFWLYAFVPRRPQTSKR